MSIRSYKTKTLSVQYDFAQDGGAVGELRLGAFFPENAIFVEGYIFTIFETLGGVGATLQVRSIDSADGLSAAFALPIPTNQVIHFTTRTIIDQVSELGIEIGVAEILQGRLLVYAQYLENNDV